MRSNGNRGLLSVVLSVVMLMTVVSATAAFGGLSPGGSFVDDDGNIHEGNIEAIKDVGITKGCNPPVNDRYCPSDSITRGQMAAFLVRALGLPATTTDAFDDDTGSVFQANINSLAAAGISKGCNPPDNDRFCPNDPVTRGQMAAFLVRGFAYTNPGVGNWFTDDDGSVFEADIDRLREAGVTAGCNPPDNDLFCPDNEVKRDQMASFLARALNLSPIVPPTTLEACIRPPDGVSPLRHVLVTPGQSPTLAEAFADARPGDHIMLAAGTHTTSGNLVLNRSGTPTDWIEITAADGASPVLDMDGSGEFRISGSYVSLTGIEIINGGGNNLHIAPESVDIRQIYVGDNVIRDLAWGPGAAIKINRNNNTGAGVGTICLENNDVSEAINNAIIDGVGVDGAVVIGNDIHDNAVGSHGIFFKGGSSDILIDGNLIRGIRANAALQLGGNTGASFWNPDYPAWEGVNQIARNNIIVDFDDSAIEIRGVSGAKVYNNTIITQSTFAIFRLQNGNNASGGSSGNDNIDIRNNLIVGTGGNPQYARNDGGSATITFGKQLWAGLFRNAGSAGPGVPSFPQSGDVAVDSGSLGTVVVDPTTGGVTGLANAVTRYKPAAGSPALGAADALSDVVKDIIGMARSLTAPTMGAIESP
jgi:S-layer family protein